MKWKIFKYLIIAGFTLGIIGSIGVGVLLYKNYKELPNIEELIQGYSAAEPTTIYDRNGQIIDIISREARVVVPIEEIPVSLQKAFMAIEDRRFRDHYGIDPIRLTGAVLANLKGSRQGGSTLTQQLAKNAFLTQERKLSRKIKELIISFEIEKTYTKDEIMERYLNEIYFGFGAYGVHSAADRFFRKDITEINTAEAALISGITNNPSIYDPRTKPQNALRRQKLVLKQMLKFGFIEQEEYDIAIAQKFVNEKNATEEDKKDPNTTIIYSSRESKIEFNAPDFTDLVEEFLFDNFSENEIYSNGLKVYTTLDLEMQKVAKETFENYSYFKNNPEVQGAMVTIDAKNGELVSIIGGKDYKTSNFNRATRAIRQVGSSFKPFVYYTALEKGYEENLVLEDSRIVYNKWAPRNFGNIYYNGITLMQGFDKSQNIVSIKLLQKVGLNSLQSVLDRLGGDLKIHHDLTAALGTTETTPLKLAQSYAIFANGGKTVEPIIVKRIVDKFNNTVYESKPTITPTFDSLSISLMTNMLQNSVKNGTSKRAQVKYKGEPIPQGGKTGTTNDSRTLWFAGFTPEYVTTLYIGNDDNKSLERATGGGTAAPLWGEFYQNLINKKLYKPGNFEFLDSHVFNGDIVYQSLDPATGLIRDSRHNKDFLLRRGKLRVEESSKYENGISGLLGYELPVYIDPNAIIEPVSETITETIYQEPQRKEPRGLLQHLFNF